MAEKIEGLEIDEAPRLARPIYWAVKKLYGKVITPIKVRSRRPKILMAEGMLDKAIHKKSDIGHRILTLAEFRVAQIVECPFWMDIVPAVGRKAKAVTKDEIKAVSNFRGSDLFSESEKVAIEYAEEMTKTPVEVSTELFDRLKEHFDDGQIIELTSAIAFENYRARLNHALGIESDNLYEK